MTKKCMNYSLSFSFRNYLYSDWETVRTQYKIYNKEAEKSMPYFIGGHPGFNCPLLDDETYEDCFSFGIWKARDLFSSKTIPRNRNVRFQRQRSPWLNNQKELDLNYDFFSYDAVTLDELESRSVAFAFTKTW